MQDKAFTGYGAILKKYRSRAGLSQLEVAKLLSTTRGTIVNWELERSQPDMYYIQQLCKELKIPASELLQIEPPPIVHEYNKDEKYIVSLYRDLSESGKELAKKNMLSIKEVEEKAQYNQCKALYFMTERPSTGAAAGAGTPFMDGGSTVQFVKRNGANERADAVIAVDGRSMEPVYHSGDLVYVMYTEEAHAGDIVICSTADGAVIKCVDENRHLYSLNSELPYGMKSEDDNVRVIGQVLGIVQPNELPQADEVSVLEEIFAKEIRAFKKERGIMD